VPPAVPISPMMARMMSLAVTPSAAICRRRYAHVLRLLLDQRLRGQHVLDFRRADAMRQRAECAMRRGVAVAADDRRARQRKALLGADDVDDALALVELVVIFDAEFAAFSAKVATCSGFPDRDALVRSVVGTLWSTTASVFSGACTGGRHAQAFERLRARHFVHQMAIDIEQAGAVSGFLDQMVVPDLVVQGEKKRVRLLTRF
jgi:hypothetical protein